MGDCKFCGREISSYYSDKDYAKDGFCSATHGNQYAEYREHYSSRKYCVECEKAYIFANVSPGYLTSGRDYICPSCVKKAKEEKEKYTWEHTRFQCDWCGKSYYRKESTAIKKEVYCSKKCEAHL